MLKAKPLPSRFLAGFALLLLLVLPACTHPADPVTKEAYLGDYSTFVTTVEKDAHNYRYRQWNKADARAEYLNNALYDRFAPELTTEEHLKIVAYRARYLTAKVTWTVREGVQKVLEKGNAPPFPG